MADKRYRVIVKELCPTCIQAKELGRIEKNCPGCKFIKYNNVTRLLKFTAFIDEKYPHWVWFKVYEYLPGHPGSELATFKNWHKTYIRDGERWIPTGTKRIVPTKEEL